MTWTEIYTKYKDTELMKEFGNYYSDGDTFRVIRFRTWDIKDIWGYLVVFAETKDVGLTVEVNNREGIDMWVVHLDRMFETHANVTDTVEQAMLWCADKFFEIGE